MASTPSDPTCPICLDPLTAPFTTPCNHTFCQTCLSAHFGILTTSRCPICRRDIRWRDIQPFGLGSVERRGVHSISETADQYDEDLDRAIAASLADQYYDSAADMEDTYGGWGRGHASAPRTSVAGSSRFERNRMSWADENYDSPIDENSPYGGSGRRYASSLSTWVADDSLRFGMDGMSLADDYPISPGDEGDTYGAGIWQYPSAPMMPVARDSSRLDMPVDEEDTYQGRVWPYASVPRTSVERGSSRGFEMPGMTFVGSFEYVSSTPVSSSRTAISNTTTSSSSSDSVDDADAESDNDEVSPSPSSSSSTLSWLSTYSYPPSLSHGIRRTITRFLSPQLIQTLVTARWDKRRISHGESFSRAVKEEARGWWARIREYVRDIEGGGKEGMGRERLIRVAAGVLEELRRAA